ncbi:MAG: hypothetical protein R6V57_03590 [Vicinamibacterales bacterium]
MAAVDNSNEALYRRAQRVLPGGGTVTLPLPTKPPLQDRRAPPGQQRQAAVLIR